MDRIGISFGSDLVDRRSADAPPRSITTNPELPAYFQSCAPIRDTTTVSASGPRTQELGGNPSWTPVGFLHEEHHASWLKATKAYVHRLASGLDIEPALVMLKRCCAAIPHGSPSRIQDRSEPGLQSTQPGGPSQAGLESYRNQASDSETKDFAAVLQATRWMCLESESLGRHYVSIAATVSEGPIREKIQATLDLEMAWSPPRKETMRYMSNHLAAGRWETALAAVLQYAPSDAARVGVSALGLKALATADQWRSALLMYGNLKDRGVVTEVELAVILSALRTVTVGWWIGLQLFSAYLFSSPPGSGVPLLGSQASTSASGPEAEEDESSKAPLFGSPVTLNNLLHVLQLQGRWMEGVKVIRALQSRQDPSKGRYPSTPSSSSTSLSAFIRPNSVTFSQLTRLFRHDWQLALKVAVGFCCRPDCVPAHVSGSSLKASSLTPMSVLENLRLNQADLILDSERGSSSSIANADCLSSRMTLQELDSTALSDMVRVCVRHQRWMEALVFYSAGAATIAPKRHANFLEADVGDEGSKRRVNAFTPSLTLQVLSLASQCGRWKKAYRCLRYLDPGTEPFQIGLNTLLKDSGSLAESERLVNFMKTQNYEICHAGFETHVQRLAEFGRWEEALAATSLMLSGHGPEKKPPSEAVHGFVQYALGIAEAPWEASLTLYSEMMQRSATTQASPVGLAGGGGSLLALGQSGSTATTRGAEPMSGIAFKSVIARCFEAGKPELAQKVLEVAMRRGVGRL
jgi:hypothetical protein